MASPYTALSWIVKSISSSLEELAPSECLACQQEGPWFCKKCQQQCLAITAPTCAFCDRLSPTGKTCPRCRPLYSLTGCRSQWHYRGPVTTIIKRSKYQSLFAAYAAFDQSLVYLFRQLPPRVQKQATLSSVPSRQTTLATRGFNQSEILAQRLSRLTDRPYTALLERSHHSSPLQTRLNRQQRLANTQAQFRYPFRSPCPQTVILVDDVITTGATLASCSTVLRQHGAATIWALTLAHD